eukprot:3941129-Rhodomonas_salina.1
MSLNLTYLHHRLYFPANNPKNPTVLPSALRSVHCRHTLSRSQMQAQLSPRDLLELGRWASWPETVQSSHPSACKPAQFQPA